MPLMVVGIIVVNAAVPEVVVIVPSGIEGLTTSTIDVIVPLIVVIAVVVKTGSVPEVIVKVPSKIEGLII